MRLCVIPGLPSPGLLVLVFGCCLLWTGARTLQAQSQREIGPRNEQAVQAKEISGEKSTSPVPSPWRGAVFTESSQLRTIDDFRLRQFQTRKYTGRGNERSSNRQAHEEFGRQVKSRRVLAGHHAVDSNNLRRVSRLTGSETTANGIVGNEIIGRGKTPRPIGLVLERLPPSAKPQLIGRTTWYVADPFLYLPIRVGDSTKYSVFKFPVD